MHRATRILVVDDVATMRKVLSIALGRMGFDQVTLASGGADALRIVEGQELDLIICDRDMPGVDGIDVLRAIRAQPRHRTTLFLMLVQARHSEQAVEAVAAGADDVLIKPFTAVGLKEKLGTLLRSSRQGAPAAGPQKDRPVILVVDDTSENNDLIAELLEPELEVVAVTSGAAGLALAESEQPPDLILLDILMPGMDGMEVCRRLKANPMTESIPVIFLSALGETDDMVAGFDLGAVDYVTKPIDLDVLRARVRTHLQLKDARDELQREVDLKVANLRLREDVERITRHDIKNPLSAIINIAGAMLLDDSLDEGVREALEYIESSAYDLLGMINRSLDLYKMETGSYRLSPGPVDLAGVLGKVQRDSEAFAHPRGVSIDLHLSDPGVTVRGEELLCYSLFGNLVRNAVEASPINGQVRVEVESGTPCTIRVRNAGVIPEAVRAHFFDKYVTHGKEGGTGLGTYSARLMAQVQGGDIAFETSEGTGTCVSVVLPGLGRDQG